MTAAMEKRLQRLESRQVKTFVPFDYAAAAVALRWVLDCYAAAKSGKACLVVRFGPHPAPTPAKLAVMRELDRVGARLAVERAG